MNLLSSRVRALELASALLVASGTAAAQAPAQEHHHHHAGAAVHHHHAAEAGRGGAFQRSQHRYTLPNLTLLDQEGRVVSVRELERGSGPLALNFIFATCNTICPVMNATFSQLLHELGPEAARIRLVSITIDPEHDTPAVLADLAKRFAAPPSWSFLTGKPGDVERVVRAFGAWSGSKATHRPITLLRRNGGTEWVRLEGLGSGSALAEQARAVIN